MVGQALRVERAWVADGPAGYLSIVADGSVLTTPPADDPWDPNSAQQDVTVDGSIRVAAEGEHLVITTTTGGIQSGFPQVFSKPPPAGYYADDVINVVRFSPDGKLLAAGTGQVTEFSSDIASSNDHTVHIWATSDWSKRYTLTEPRYSVRALAWSPDGRYIAAAGGLENKYGMFYGDNVVRVWILYARADGGDAQPAPPSLALTLVGHTTTVEALAWSPDGSRLVSRDLSGRVVIWRVP
jgi:WD40 repeat protein